MDNFNNPPSKLNEENDSKVGTKKPVFHSASYNTAPALFFSH